MFLLLFFYSCVCVKILFFIYGIESSEPFARGFTEHRKLTTQKFISALLIDSCSSFLWHQTIYFVTRKNVSLIKFSYMERVSLWWPLFSRIKTGMKQPSDSNSLWRRTHDSFTECEKKTVPDANIIADEVAVHF